MEFKNSELRQDLVSGDWIVIASQRGKRPNQLIKKTKKREIAPKTGCPFEDLQKSGHGEPILIYRDKKEKWQIQIVNNKYPAFRHQNKCVSIFKNGPYSVTQAIGHHDLVVTRDHNKNFSRLSFEEALKVFESFRERYLMLLEDPCTSYVSIFHNWGPAAGASIYHPHYQIIAIPVIPPDVEHSLEGSRRFYKKHKKCVHCVMISQELKKKIRIIFQNKEAIAFAPFVSKEPFEVRIFPKKHLPYFENTPDRILADIVETLQFVLKKISKNMKDPDYNFFIHTAPIKDKRKYKNYHWHIEVVPKTNIDAGFELSTGVEINSVDPDEAAKFLKK